MIGWLLFMADSMTSLVALLIGGSIVAFLALPFVNARYAVACLFGTLLTLACAEAGFGFTTLVIGALGRDPTTLTGRLDVWQSVRALEVNPLIGAGFESFWLGDRLLALWSQYWWRPNQAHNGYLETYLNLGWIGLVLLFAWMLTAFVRARRALLSDPDWGRFQLGVLGIMLVYNYTEAAFKLLHPLCFLLFLAGLQYPSAAFSGVQRRDRPSHVAATTRNGTGRRIRPVGDTY